MKISKLVLLLVAVLATSHCLTMHTTQYILTNPNYNTRSLKVLVDLEEGFIRFQGCNLNAAKITRDSAGNFTIFNWVTTIAYCVRNNDPKIRSLFSSARTSKSEGGTVRFYDKQGK